MRRLSKTKEEFLQAKGWSAAKFAGHAAVIIDGLERSGRGVEYGRSVIYVRGAAKLVKLYVHHNGRSDDWLTIAAGDGVELQSLHCSRSPEDLLAAILALSS